MKRFLFLALLSILASASSVHGLNSSLQTMEDQALVLQERGHYLQALGRWEQLQKRYKKAGLQDKAAGATIQIALTQQSLGYVVAACYTLRGLLDVREKVCVPSSSQAEQVRSTPSLKTPNDAIAAINFARILRDLGAYENAIPFADAALSTAQQNGYTNLVSPIAIAKGTIQWAKVQQAYDQWQYQGRNTVLRFEAQDLIANFQSSFQAYESAFDGESEIDAKLKWLQLYQDLDKQAAAYRDDLVNDLKAERQADALALRNEILSLDKQDFQQFSLSERLRLMKDRAKLMLNSKNPESKRFIQELLDAAHDHQEYLAAGYGLLGEWYQGNDNHEQAIGAYHQASILGGEQHPLFQWQYEIARSFEKLGNERQAERFYESAIELLDKAQRDVAPVENSLKLHFQEAVRPIYDDYSRFQLSKENPNIARVFEVRNQFNANIVEFYLGCGKLENLAIEEITQQDPSAAYVSIFRVGELYYTLLKQGESYSYRMVEASKVEESVEPLDAIFDSTFVKLQVPILNTYLESLYRSILQPIENEFKPGQTLLFVGLEPKLQKIPMSALFNGENYLIEKHPIGFITNSLRSETRQTSLSSLFVGLADQPNSNYSNLPYVADEAEVVGPNKVFLNEQFTRTQLAQAIQNDYEVLHIATHGQFSSNPQKTFLLAWDQKLTLTDIRAMIKERAIKQIPIDLLILSACETAKGDRLAGLGIAGISIEAGARSTLASLWQAIDSSSPFFMERFYSYLRAGEPKARAVQLAQIDMIKAEFPPYSWATYILTGDWL